MEAQQNYNIGLFKLNGTETTRGVVYFASETREWYRVTKREVQLLGRMLLDNVDEAYSQWCAATPNRRARKPREV